MVDVSQTKPNALKCIPLLNNLAVEKSSHRLFSPNFTF